MLPKVDAHAFKSICGQDWDQTGIFLFELICDIFEGFSHRILDHLLLSLLDLLESLIEVVKNLHKEWWAVVLHLLSYHCDAFFFKGDGVHKEVDHVSKLTRYYSLVTFVSSGKRGNSISSTSSSELSATGWTISSAGFPSSSRNSPGIPS